MGIGILACALYTFPSYAPPSNWLSRLIGGGGNESAETLTEDQGPAYELVAEKIQELYRTLQILEAAARDMGIDVSPNSEWRRQLEDKLLAQLGLDKMLLVAVAGGTNTGKSSVFNHLAGAKVSGVVETGGGTKHPVLLVPKKFSAEIILKKLFPEFELRARKSAGEATVANDKTQLYWEVGGSSLDDRLLLFDTPDVDSSQRANWERAARVVRAADVTIAIVTEEKHTDDKVINFFKKAKEEGKPIIVVINKADLDYPDEWRAWLEKFKEQSGVVPTEVYVVPRDRDAAAANKLNFYKVGPDGKCKIGDPVSLRDELTKLHIDDILYRTRRGAVREALTDKSSGALKLIDEITTRSGQFEQVLTGLQSTTILNDEVQLNAWPTLPFEVLVNATYDWWNMKRPAYVRGVNWVYDVISRPIRGAIRETAGAGRQKTADDFLQLYQREEAASIRDAVNMVLDALAPVLEFRAGKAFDVVKKLTEERQDIVNRIAAAHEKLPPITDGFRDHMGKELDEWEKEHPGIIAALKTIDMGAAVLRPPVTLALSIGSVWLASGAVPTSAAALQAAKTFLVDGGTAVTVGGGAAGVAQDAALKSTVGDGSFNATVFALFNRLREAYIYSRLDWLVKKLNFELSGVIEQLEIASTVSRTPAYQSARSCADWLVANVK